MTSDWGGGGVYFFQFLSDVLNVWSLKHLNHSSWIKSYKCCRFSYKIRDFCCFSKKYDDVIIFIRFYRCYRFYRKINVVLTMYSANNAHCPFSDLNNRGTHAHTRVRPRKQWKLTVKFIHISLGEEKSSMDMGMQKM